MTFSVLTSRTICLVIISVLCWVSPAFSQNQSSALEQELKTAIKTKNYPLAVEKSKALAEFHTTNKAYSKAIPFYEQAVKYSKSSNDTKSIYQSYLGLGHTYSALKNYKQAISCWQESYNYSLTLRDAALTTESLSLIGQAQIQGRNFKDAISTWDKLLIIAIENKNDSLQQICYNQLANCQDGLGNKTKANAYRELSNQIAEVRKNEQIEKKRIADLTKDVASAKKEVASVKKEVASVNSQLEQSQITLSEQARQLKITEDSLLKAEAVNRETRLQVELMNKDRELAESKFREQETMAQQERQLRNGAAIVAALAIALVVIVVLDFKKKKAANKKIEEQNKSIKSSINYAKRIQEAMLPRQACHHFAKDCFILFKPRDVVSGDFYWFNELRYGQSGDFSFAAVDCTGHGVPGAFMSMIGLKALSEITARGIHQPGEILSAMHREVQTSLRQKETGNNDGMDVALCTFHSERNRLEFAGAKNPLVLIQNNELRQIKGDIHPIGGSKSPDNLVYKNHIVTIDEPTTLYLFSDGYRDQFGGKNNTKFMSKQFSQLLLEIHALPMDEQKQILEKRFDDWKGTHPQTDDVLVIGLKLEPA